MRSVQSLVISASMKQIVPLIAVKMWCWIPLRFWEGSSLLHGFILRYSQAVRTRQEIIIKEEKKLICIYFRFLFDLELGSKFRMQFIFMDSKLWKCCKWNVFVWSETGVSLCFKMLYSHTERKQHEMWDLTECSWPNKDAGSNIAIEMTSLWHKKHPAWFLCRISDRTASITSEESARKVREVRRRKD